ncbi:b4 [miniopterid betaherpesvirus 1]|uniref:B4 n=1 Tax=miniopterid betaherpesvirus 1 TaxID=3070189 RepID=I3VPY5_9BETA|nr:b4 [miniopterid betaherpesvirus 1]AFK83829.1 b4 [miniopterid betaherpesvirus 1]
MADYDVYARKLLGTLFVVAVMCAMCCVDCVAASGASTAEALSAGTSGGESPTPSATDSVTSEASSTLATPTGSTPETESVSAPPESGTGFSPPSSTLAETFSDGLSSSGATATTAAAPSTASSGSPVDASVSASAKARSNGSSAARGGRRPLGEGFKVAVKRLKDEYGNVTVRTFWQGKNVSSVAAIGLYQVLRSGSAYRKVYALNVSRYSRAPAVVGSISGPVGDGTFYRVVFGINNHNATTVNGSTVYGVSDLTAEVSLGQPRPFVSGYYEWRVWVMLPGAARPVVQGKRLWVPLTPNLRVLCEKGRAVVATEVPPGLWWQTYAVFWSRRPEGSQSATALGAHVVAGHDISTYGGSDGSLTPVFRRGAKTYVGTEFVGPALYRIVTIAHGVDGGDRRGNASIVVGSARCVEESERGSTFVQALVILTLGLIVGLCVMVLGLACVICCKLARPLYSAYSEIRRLGSSNEKSDGPGSLVVRSDGDGEGEGDKGPPIWVSGGVWKDGRGGVRAAVKWMLYKYARGIVAVSLGPEDDAMLLPPEKEVLAIAADVLPLTDGGGGDEDGEGVSGDGDGDGEGDGAERRRGGPGGSDGDAGLRDDATDEALAQMFPPGMLRRRPDADREESVEDGRDGDDGVFVEDDPWSGSTVSLIGPAIHPV